MTGQGETQPTLRRCSELHPARPNHVPRYTSRIATSATAPATRAAETARRALAAGEVVTTYLDAADQEQVATVQHEGGVLALPPGPSRVYTSVKLDGVEQLDPGDLSAWTIEWAGVGTYLVRTGGA